MPSSSYDWQYRKKKQLMQMELKRQQIEQSSLISGVLQRKTPDESKKVMPKLSLHQGVSAI